MQIFIVTLTGKTFSLDVKSHYTIQIVKKKLQEKENILSSSQSLFLSGTRLRNHHTLQHYNVFRDSTLDLVLSTRSVSSKRIFALACKLKITTRLSIATSKGIRL